MEQSSSFPLPNTAPDDMPKQATDFDKELFTEEPVTQVPSLLEHVRNLGSDVPDLEFSCHHDLEGAQILQEQQSSRS